ncbi:MAG: hypothetical protein NVS2B6_10790 [Thermoleophilaceae bacterium]
MAEDWRLRVDLEEGEHGAGLAQRLESTQLEAAVKRELGGRIAVSHDGPVVFLYADTEASARAAERIVTSLLNHAGWSAEIALDRWHDDAERWEAAGQPRPSAGQRSPAPEGDAEQSEWEVRVSLPSRRAARELSERLDAEGVSHVHRWRYVFVGATDEAAARTWAERLRGEAPAGSEIAVEGTYAAIERHNPFALIRGLPGGP